MTVPYLVHLPVLAAVVHGSSGLLSLPVALLLGALLCLPAAELFYTLVERPALVLSRNIGVPWHSRPRLPQFPGPVAP